MNRRDMLKTLGVSSVAAAAWSAAPVLAGAAASPAGRDGGWFADGQYKLPPLPYAYDALEPHIDAKTVEIHHDRHHAAYVQGLNATLEKLAEARKKPDFAAIRALSRDLAFNGAGVVLHNIYWSNMKPNGGGRPIGELAKAIDASFGGFEPFKAQLAAAATAVEASGWGLLVYESISGALRVMQAERHEDLTQWSVVPLLVLDVWEHAYYLKYQNRRQEYVRAFFEVVNWDDVQGRLAQAVGFRMK